MSLSMGGMLTGKSIGSLRQFFHGFGDPETQLLHLGVAVFHPPGFNNFAILDAIDVALTPDGGALVFQVCTADDAEATH